MTENILKFFWANLVKIVGSTLVRTDAMTSATSEDSGLYSLSPTPPLYIKKNTVFFNFFFDGAVIGIGR